MATRLVVLYKGSLYYAVERANERYKLYNMSRPDCTGRPDTEPVRHCVKVMDPAEVELAPRMSFPRGLAPQPRGPPPATSATQVPVGSEAAPLGGSTVDEDIEDLEDFEEEVSIAESESQLRDQIEELTADIRAKEIELAGLKSGAEVRGREVAGLSEDVSKLRGQVDNLKSTVHSKDMELW